jgi:hypothetical protein
MRPTPTFITTQVYQICLLCTTILGNQATAVEISGISTGVMVGNLWIGTRARIWRILVALPLRWLCGFQRRKVLRLTRSQGSILAYRNIEPWTDLLL